MRLFKNKYSEVRSGWAILLAIVLILAGQLTAGALTAALSPGDPDAAGAGLKIAVTLLYGCITVIGGLLLFRLLYGQSPRKIGLSGERWLTEALHGFAMGVASMGLVFAALLASGQAGVRGIDYSKLFSFTLVVEFCSLCVFAFSEELLTRGFMMTALKTTRNKYVVFFLPAALFSLMHFMNPGVTIISFANTFLVGILFAYMFVRTGKLWLPSGFHIAWNFLLGDVLGMNVSGLEAYAVVNTQITGTNQLLTGGSYGPEGGLIVTVILALGIVYTRFLIKRAITPPWTFDSDLPMARQSGKM
jgi:membrane protease YdiL (CAAX protease family)